MREHLIKKLRMSDRQAGEIEDPLRDYAELVEPAHVPKSACQDPDDLPVLGTAIAGRAGALVTGDKDLLALGEFAGIPILSPRAFYDRLPKLRIE